MPRKISADKVRFSISVPAADTSVLEWLKAQDNMSLSLRILVKREIAAHGMTDVLCHEPVQGTRRTRPAEQAAPKAQAKQETNQRVEPEVSQAHDVYEVPKQSRKEAAPAVKATKPTASPKVLAPPAATDDFLDEDGFIDDPAAILGI